MRQSPPPPRPPWHTRCSVRQMAPPLDRLLRLGVTVALVTYATLPFVVLLFRHWIALDRPVFDRQPMRTLDQGLASLWAMMGWLAVYCVPFLVRGGVLLAPVLFPSRASA